MRDTKSIAHGDLALTKEFVRRLAQEVDPRLFTVTLSVLGLEAMRTRNQTSICSLP
jgi:hypothetical protein